MSLDSAIVNRNSLLTTAGKNVMNIKYPKEFELYLCALELINESGKTLKYFVFPVMPNSIRESKPKITNVKKTLAGVTVLSTTTFIPTDISLSGNFGRSFKVLLGGDYTEFASAFSSSSSGSAVGNGLQDFFDDRIKTGYGCIKILEEIIDQADKIGDDGKLCKLILHNPSLGNSYIVKPVGALEFSMTEQTNMIWSYSVQFKSVAPLEAFFTTKELEEQSKRLNITGYIQKKVDVLLNSIASFSVK